MHELTLCRAIAAIAERHAQGQAVASVRVRVGRLRQVVPETLARCFEIVAAQGPLAGARLELIDVPARVRCRDCDGVTVLERLELRCGSCGGTDLEVIAGEELFVESLELRE
jgi:hydrogenase nickel incorporation protein HypA/HybF